MTVERQPNTELREKAREWVNEKYPDGDFAQFNDPILDLVSDLTEFAASIQAEARALMVKQIRAIADGWNARINTGDYDGRPSQLEAAQIRADEGKDIALALERESK